MAHRKLLATTSWLLALIAALLAVPGTLLPTMVVWSAAQSEVPLVIPWATIGLVVVFVPLSAALVAGVVARTPKLGSLLGYPT